MSDDKRTPADGSDDDAQVEAIGFESDRLWKDTPEARRERAEAKKALLEESLGRGKTQIRVDTRRAGCRVPEAYAGDCQLVLNLSWRFSHAHMVVNERGLAATLRFAGDPFRCVLPWTAVWGVTPFGEEKLRVWPADLPFEFGGPPRGEPESEPEPVEAMKPRLSVVPPKKASVAETAAEPDAPAPPVEEPTKTVDQTDVRPRAPWLKLVK